MTNENLKWCSVGGFVGGSLECMPPDPVWIKLVTKKVILGLCEKLNIAEEWSKNYVASRNGHAVAGGSARSSYRKVPKYTHDQLLDKFYEYEEAEKDYELRTGKTRKSLSKKEFFELAIDEGCLDDGSDAVVEPTYGENEVFSSVPQHVIHDCSWYKVVMSKRKIRTQVLQIYVDVIKEIFMEPHTSIELFDTDKGVPYPCVFKSRDKKIEEFLSKGWYKFLKDRDLCEGDVVHFKV
ncbi:unnamed protein product [Vicia faba]|uniref:TF-B3 domain-containing protein n=1 Tax=Vicia faba TaxID=3906 RepID=A0AAV1A3Q5_VICFA|nr:unnamed protein product [Vicia faba]